VLRYVDLSTTHISDAVKLAAPAWARTIIPGAGGSPLLYSGTRDGLPSAVLAFEPRRSDLPLQVAFPVLLSNLAGELMGGSSAPSDVLAPGMPVNLALPAGATGIRVTRPDGTSVDVPAGAPSAASVTFASTTELGVYTGVPIGLPEPGASPAAPSTSLDPSDGAASSAGTSASAGSAASAPATASPVDSRTPVRFAVDLFDIDESNIAPGSGAAIAALGVPPPTPNASAAPGASPAGAAASTARPPARDELWGPIVLIVLLGLALEWAVYERDAVIRWRRSIAVRLGRRPAGGRRATGG
jgi:hypothetical protein